ncbi:GtrA family protein [bacterium]|nr:MAG: GtrA family protein [bacterium]
MSLQARRLWSFYASRQFARFLAVGGVALGLHWLSRFFFNTFVGYGTAIVLAYGVGIAVAFVLNKLFVFPYGTRGARFEMLAFVAVNVAAFPFVWGVAYALGEWVFNAWMPREPALALAHGIAITLPVFANFALHKLVTFRGS